MIYKVTPRDRKGEQDANSWYTEDEKKATRAVCDGHEVFMATFNEGTLIWKPAEVIIRIAQ